MARDSTAVGKEMLLNFCRFLRRRPSLSPWRLQRDHAIAEYRHLFGAQEKSASSRKNFRSCNGDLEWCRARSSPPRCSATAGRTTRPAGILARMHAPGDRIFAAAKRSVPQTVPKRLTTPESKRRTNQYRRTRIQRDIAWLGSRACEVSKRGVTR